MFLMKKSEGDHSLNFFCKDQSSFKAKIGILSLYKAHFPAWLEKLLMTFEYLQLLSLTILLHPSVSQFLNPNVNNHYIYEVIAGFFKLVNPSYLLPFTHSDATTLSVLRIILAYLLFKYFILAYALYISYVNKEPNSQLKSLWRWIFKLQGRATCCFITSFWVRTIVTASNDTFSIQGIANQAVMAISAVLIIVEYMISFILETQLSDFLPSSKKFLASKNHDMQIITLLQKLVIQLIQLFVDNNISAGIWACIIWNLTLSLIREYRFFTTLPLYNYKSLLYQGDLTTIALSLHIVHFFHQILKEIDYQQETDFRFIIMSWIIIGILFLRISRGLIQEIYTRLLTQNHPKGNPNFLLHKIFATKYLIKNIKIPMGTTEKTDIHYLLALTQTLNLSEVFHLPSRKGSSELLKNKEEVASLMLEYLEHLSNIFPSNSLIKLNFAYRNYKSTNFYAKIIKSTSKLNENILSPYYMSSILLLHDLQSTKFKDTEVKANNVDLNHYIKNRLLIDEIQNEILKQIMIRKQICEGLLGEKPDLEAIYQSSQIVHRSKMLILNKIGFFLKQAPEYNLHPLLVFAEYSLYLNYSIEDYHHYYENYARKMSKFTKEFEANNLSEENLYQDRNAFLIISAENNYLGYSTKSLQDICGLDKNNYKNTPITRLFPHSLQDYYNKILKGIFEKGHTEFANKRIPALLCHKEGWLLEADILLRVHPYMSTSLYLNMLIRPYQTSTEFLLLDENGNIGGASRTIAEFLHLNKSASINVKQISEDLANLNRNNYQLNDDKNSSSGNRIIELSRAKLQTAEDKNSFSTSLRCRVLTIDSTTFPLNLIKLEVISHYELSENLITSNSAQENDFQEREQINDIPSSNRFWNLTTKEMCISEAFKGPSQSTQYKDEPLSATTQQYQETEDPIMSPATSRALFKSRFFSTKYQMHSRTNTMNTDHHPYQAPINHNTLVRPPLLPVSAAKISASTHESTKVSQVDNIFKAFQQAINTKTYQRSFNFLCLIFYGVILLTLISQIVLKSVLDSTMSHLIIKTNLLNYAQKRTLQANSIHNTARGCLLLIGGLLTPGDMNLADSPLRQRLANMMVSLEVMAESNEGIMNNLASESDEIKKMLFEKDINIKGSFADPLDSNTELITNFQHSHMLASVFGFLNSLELLASDAGARAFEFLTFNTVNDFLAKNEEIIEAFKASVHKQKESFQSLLNASVIVLPLLLAGVVCLVAAIILKQYTTEKRHLLAFLKLNPIMVQKILENLKSFERKLVGQEKLQEHIAPHLIYQLERNTEFTNYHKGHSSQRIRSGKMQRRYFFYIFRVLFYVALLISIVIANYICITQAIKEIYNKQRQLQYSNYISSIVSTTYIAFSEAFVTNNTNYIMRQPPFEVFKQGRIAVGEIQANMYKEFQLEDGSFDPDVKAILFEEVDCSHFITASHDNCISLQSLGLPNKMVSLITLYKNMLDFKLAQYNALDKSSLSTMISAALVKLSYLLAPYRVSATEAQIISEIISDKLAESVDDLYNLGTTILIIFSLTLAAVSGLIWVQILTKVKEVNNDFKKVLAVFPANIILSSFLLKSFLNKTSNIAQKL